MNKRLLTLSVLLAIAGTATAMQTIKKNPQGLVTNYDGPIKGFKADFKGGRTAVTKTATLPDGTVLNLDPTVQWNVNNNYLKRATPLAPAAPVAKAPVAPAPAAPKAPTIIKPAAAPAAAAAAALKPAAPVAKPAAVSFAPVVAKPAPVVKPAAPELRATIVPAPAELTAPQRAIITPAARPQEITEERVIMAPAQTAEIIVTEEEPAVTLEFKPSKPAAPAVESVPAPAQEQGWLWRLYNSFMAPPQNAPEETTVTTPAPAATRTAVQEADALIAEASLGAPETQQPPLTPEQQAEFDETLEMLLKEADQK